ncbi:glycosyltransferase family 4 protein [Vallicoccus soli]|uniref:Glycosyltransferase family 1 protein n=1 Tax=Vallicoccus soli TaxID=2339232 RepID=A0A3A3Z4L7_9ACTN|nr:glycosyltransferase family 4 protein [Vallicoccus soli]RJK97913.1 glycosyltransferase family 1 protein [Vallicoccus soli]
MRLEATRRLVRQRGSALEAGRWTAGTAGAPPTRGAVLHVSQVSEIGGLTHCLLDHLVHQRALGWSVLLACPPGELADRAGDAGVQVLAWEAARAPGRSTGGEVAALHGLVRSTAPDLLHLHCAKAGLAGRLAVRGGLPTVFSPHAWSWRAVEGAVRRQALAWERFAVRWTDLVVCVSEAERREGEDAGVRARWEVVPNRVDLPAHALLRTRAAARSALGVPQHARVVVCVGRLCRQKGQDVLLDAWERLQGAGLLVLVGGGPMEEEIVARAAGLRGVRLVGVAPRHEALSWMTAADVVALPSRWEGMSIAALEARALQRPVVASDVVGMAEALEGAAATLVPPDDPAGLARALSAALAATGSADQPPGLSDPWGEPATLHGARRLSELYEDLLARRPAPRPRRSAARARASAAT